MSEIKATIADLTFSFGGGQTLSLKTKDDCRGLYEALKEKDLRVALKVYRKKRSKNANSYMWELITKLSDKIGTPKDEIYREYITKGNVYKQIEINEAAVDTFIKAWSMHGVGWIAEKLDYAPHKGFTVINAYYGSSTYNTKQMSRLIDLIVQDCKEQDIETMTPEQLAVLKNDWRSQ